MFEQLPTVQSITTGFGQRMLFGLKARLYNAMISPFLYWLPHAMPFLHLGETSYYALSAIDVMDQVRLNLLACNIARYQSDVEAPTRCEKISSMVDSLGSSSDRINNLPRVCESGLNHRLLRYPLLLEAVSRDRVYQRLIKAGLGASIMYPASLPKIAGMTHTLDKKQRFPNAEVFASRLLTLPTHLHVSEKIKAILSESV